MRVLVIGANGGVSRHFADFVKDSDTIEEVAAIRNLDQAPFFEERGIESVYLDLTKHTQADIENILTNKKIDAVIFSAGACGTGDDIIMMVDLDGAIKSMQAAEAVGIKRFVIVSTFRTGREEIEKNVIRVYTTAKTYADEWLKSRTNLDWTIVHPGVLRDEPGSGKITTQPQDGIRDVARQNVAKTLLAVLENDNTIGKEFEVVDGDTDITTAVQNL
ncbi:nucleoside-diphosphate sugar epimerase [Aerococcus viridans]|uniref:Nucleoside-diphosphate sugar epimerase n=1 Tax=Aerococcus viridans TaxID=1377 RepID=A0A2N6UGD4_9LACT|nr:SDR family oxidoreductase [Aerococcus viridans]PMC80566.1 nucleoside-diphosphate sugar epimerase [Aerococcus viridans]